jgi:hypothetical protein
VAAQLDDALARKASSHLAARGAGPRTASSGAGSGRRPAELERLVEVSSRGRYRHRGQEHHAAETSITLRAGGIDRSLDVLLGSPDVASSHRCEGQNSLAADDGGCIVTRPRQDDLRLPSGTLEIGVGE